MECSSNPEISITRVQNTTALIEEKDWKKTTDHRPLTLKVPAQLKLKDVRKRIAKALFYSPATKKEVKQKYEDQIPELTTKLRIVTAESSADEVRELYADIQQAIIGPWEKVVRARPPGKPVWWHPGIGAAQRKRGKLAKKWHEARSSARKWTDNGLANEEIRAHDELKVQKKEVRQLSRQAKARFETSVKQRLTEAGIIDNSRAVRKDRRGKALR